MNTTIPQCEHCGRLWLGGFFDQPICNQCLEGEQNAIDSEEVGSEANINEHQD